MNDGGRAPTTTPAAERGHLARWLFLRGLALVYLAAFASLWVQLDGLFAQGGLLPAARLLEEVRAAYGEQRFLRWPTLLWWLGASDRTLHGLCAAGVLLSAVAAAGVAQRAAFAALWLLYLSLAGADSVFLAFQWDALLLETGLLAACYAPPGLRPRWRTDRRPSPVGRFALRFLLFKLVFLSGWVKLASGDASWRELTALDFHYWTQPLPSALGWHAHQLPPLAGRASVAVVLAVELVAPFAFLLPGASDGPRRGRVLARVRHAAAWATLLLMAAIAATGSYGFFNLLTACLCLVAFDDAALERLVRRARRGRPGAPAIGADAPASSSRALRAAPAALAAVLTVLSATRLVAAVAGVDSVPGPLRAAAQRAAPFRSVNGYGLFADMTEERPEIELEGSRDGRVWRRYAFRWKPGALDRAPRHTGLHMPRLDWQMWFAALGGLERTPWFGELLLSLLEGRPDVLALLAHDPFGGEPPRYVRARLHRYRFTTRAEREHTGRFWERTDAGLYCPTVTARDGRLVRVR